jgi:hypothetical protein
MNRKIPTPKTGALQTGPETQNGGLFENDPNDLD